MLIYLNQNFFFIKKRAFRRKGIWTLNYNFGGYDFNQLNYSPKWMFLRKNKVNKDKPNAVSTAIKTNKNKNWTWTNKNPKVGTNKKKIKIEETKINSKAKYIIIICDTKKNNKNEKKITKKKAGK